MRLTKFLNETSNLDINDFTLMETRLLELRNILNTDEITDWSKEQSVSVATRVTQEPEQQAAIYNWMSRALRKYILTSVRGEKVGMFTGNQKWHTRNKSGELSELPPWAQKALLSGDDLEFIDPVSTNRDKNVPTLVNFVRDWLRYKLRTTPEQITPNRLSRISFENAIKLADDYHQELERKRPASETEVRSWYLGDDPAELRKWIDFDFKEKQLVYKEFTKQTGRPVTGTKDTPEHHKVVKEYQDGSKWVMLTTKSCLNYEGNMMGNCVADYGDEVESGQVKIYSFRDSNNEPHITIEKNAEIGGEISQVKGKGNKPPTIKYYQPVIDVFNEIYNEEGSIMTNSEADGDIAIMGMYHDSSTKSGTITIVSPPFDPDSFSFQSIEYSKDDWDEETSEQTLAFGTGKISDAMMAMAPEYSYSYDDIHAEVAGVLNTIITDGKWEQEEEGETVFENPGIVNTIWYNGEDKDVEREWKVVVPINPVNP